MVGSCFVYEDWGYFLYKTDDIYMYDDLSI